MSKSISSDIISYLYFTVSRRQSLNTLGGMEADHATVKLQAGRGVTHNVFLSGHQRPS